MFGLRTNLPIAKDENIQWRLIDGKAVLINVDEGIVFEMNDIATRIWLVIDGGKTAQEIVTYIIDNFEVEGKRAKKDVYRFLRRLINNEAVKLIKAEG